MMTSALLSVLVRTMEEAVLVENVRSAQRCNWYADKEQGSGLRPIINSAMQELSNTDVLRCTLYVDRCMTEHKRSAGPGV